MGFNIFLGIFLASSMSFAAANDGEMGCKASLNAQILILVENTISLKNSDDGCKKSDEALKKSLNDAAVKNNFSEQEKVETNKILAVVSGLCEKSEKLSTSYKALTTNKIKASKNSTENLIFFFKDSFDLLITVSKNSQEEFQKLYTSFVLKNSSQVLKQYAEEEESLLSLARYNIQMKAAWYLNEYNGCANVKLKPKSTAPPINT